MKEVKQKLSLSRPATYQIRVPGELDESWSEWVGNMTITVECEDVGPPVTTLTGTVDQTVLHGLLRPRGVKTGPSHLSELRRHGITARRA